MTQRVLITAGAGGTGLAIAKAFAANGGRVHIADVNAEAVKEITAQDAAITGIELGLLAPVPLVTAYAGSTDLTVRFA